MIRRVIEKKIFNYIDGKLGDNPFAIKAIKDKNPRPIFIEAARSLYGIKETTGNNDGELVELLQETIGGHSNEAWCMGAVQTLLSYVETLLSINSPVYASEGCIDVWDNTPKKMRVKTIPLPGAIAIWQHGTTNKGHCGVVLGADNKTFFSIEGNTSAGSGPNGEIVREGGAMLYQTRSMKGQGSMKILGFLKPF